MTSTLSDVEFREFLDVFVKSTQKVVSKKSELKDYQPLLYLIGPELRHFNLLPNESDEVLTHHVLLRLVRDFGAHWYAEVKCWPQAVAIAYRDELGITILGCTEDGRTAMVALEYRNDEIEVRRSSFTNRNQGIARNPAAWFYGSGPLASLLP